VANTNPYYQLETGVEDEGKRSEGNHPKQLERIGLFLLKVLRNVSVDPRAKASHLRVENNANPDEDAATRVGASFAPLTSETGLGKGKNKGGSQDNCSSTLSFYTGGKRQNEGSAELIFEQVLYTCGVDWGPELGRLITPRARGEVKVGWDAVCEEGKKKRRLL